MTTSDIKYVVELKCSSHGGRWSNPGRIWVRGYADGKRVYQEHIAFVDMRYRGPRSRCGRLLEEAALRAEALASE